ncbi:MAG: TAXI family TRAP transporter solute-binding subunit [Gemmatimonadota bacterium]
MFFAMILLAGCTPGERPVSLAVATAGTGGVFYLLGGGVSEVWSRDLPGLRPVAEVTGGSVENLNLLARGEVDVAFSIGTTALQSYRATGPFAAPGGEVAGQTGSEVRALLALYPNVLHLVTLDGTGVGQLSELAGRRVSVGAPGSGTEVAARALLDANGVGYNQLQVQRLNFNETANALRDGQVDVGFLSVGPPASALMDLATARPMRLLSLTDGEVERMRSLDSTHSLHVMDGGLYPGVDEPVATAATPNVLAVRADMDEELAYNLARSVLDGRDELAGVHPVARLISVEYTLQHSPIPLHPGTIRLLEERGYAVPPGLRPPESRVHDGEARLGEAPEASQGG